MSYLLVILNSFSIVSRKLFIETAIKLNLRDYEMVDVQIDEILLSDYMMNLGQDIVKEMIALYKQQSILYLNDISNAVAEEHTLLWQELCHKFKGAAGSAGLQTLYLFLLEIEKSSAEKKKKEAFLAQLTELNSSGITAIEQWVDNY